MAPKALEAVSSKKKTAAAAAPTNKAGKAGSVTNSIKKSATADSAETHAIESAKPQAKQEAKIASKAEVKVKAEVDPSVTPPKAAAAPVPKAVAPKPSVSKAPAPVAPAPVSSASKADVKGVKSEAKPAEPAKAPSMPESKITAVAKAEASKPATASTVAPAVAATAAKPADASEAAKVTPKMEPPRQPGAQRTGFKSQEFIVYPAHGVGQIVAIEEQEVAGYKLELYVINFAKDKMTLKVPLPKVLAGAIRKLADEPIVKRSLDTLTGRARVKRTMWSRRAQEYEAKINSGDLIAIAEVVRDLYRSEAQPEQSYSERQLYEAAVDRMARELSAVRKITDSESLKLVEQHLERGPKRGPRNEALADAEGDAEPEVETTTGEIEAAA
ncbi:MAG: CarD family transcriptional regulator [Beijerinckiaceae bacterium]|nr:CarD family transcriptional regulator [Beijerinckiaceae bacterium]